MNGYPICHHDPYSSCPRFGSLDTKVTENRFSMVVEHFSGDWQKWVHPSVSITDCTARISLWGSTVIVSQWWRADYCSWTKELRYISGTNPVLWLSAYRTALWLRAQHTVEISSPVPIRVNAEVKTLVVKNINGTFSRSLIPLLV